MPQKEKNDYCKLIKVVERIGWVGEVSTCFKNCSHIKKVWMRSLVPEKVSFRLRQEMSISFWSDVNVSYRFHNQISIDRICIKTEISNVRNQKTNLISKFIGTE
jgi:hypothetical protein